MKLKFITLVVFLLLAYPTLCQQKKIYQHYEQLWIQYYNQTRLSDKWGLWFDVGYRTKDDLVEGTSTLLGRIGAIYYLNSTTRFAAGYAFFDAYPLEVNINIPQPEHRLWQLVQFQKDYSKLSMTNAIRFEQRWRQKIIPPDRYDDQFNFNYRLRFAINLQYPLTNKKLKEGDLSLVGGDEIMLNFGKEIVYNYLDQNRLYGGLRYYFSPGNSVSMLYMNTFSQINLPAVYRIFNVIRISYNHNLDLRH